MEYGGDPPAGSAVRVTTSFWQAEFFPEIVTERGGGGWMTVTVAIAVMKSSLLSVQTSALWQVVHWADV
jgi:hypothetical protein